MVADTYIRLVYLLMLFICDLFFLQEHKVKFPSFYPCNNKPMKESGLNVSDGPEITQ